MSAESPSNPRRAFETTHWSLVLSAGGPASVESKQALEKLCRAYWYPLYAHIRRKGYSATDAEDLIQEFFTRLLSRNFLNVADRNRGTFRSFLLGSLEHFLVREWTKARAQKRGGGQIIVSLEGMDAESRYLAEPKHEMTAERIFDRRWALTLLDAAMARLREECAAAGKADLLGKVGNALSGDRGDGSYAAIAAELNTSEGAVKVAVHRLRKRFGELVREEIAQTVTTSEEIDQELRALFAAFRG
jgi:RNA polymerase sigma-70 factor (ECF subfamily)